MENERAIEALDKLVSEYKGFVGELDYPHSNGHKYLETIRKALEAPEWQDISTAPKDGETLIVSGKAVQGFKGRYVCEAYSFEGGFSTDQGRLTNQPTHWQPLPQPPRTENEG